MSSVFQRGEFRTPGDKVEPHTPAVLHAMKVGADVRRLASNAERGTRNAEQSQSLETSAPTRLDLAQWLISRDNPLVAREDIEQAAKDLDIPAAQLAVLLIVSVHRESGVVKLSVNARAPILLHAVRRLATQHVFASTKYQIRQPLTL